MNNLDYDKNLFESLKILRTTLAANDEVPAFCVFYDSTAKDISRLYPQTLEELLTIHGINEKKSQKYGEAILDVVNNYIKFHNIKIKKQKIATKKHQACEEINYDKKLFNILCNYVKENNFFRNPYPQITYSTIKDICRTYPTSLRTLLQIQGIGRKKIELYGSELIKLIQDYTIANPNTVKGNLEKYSDIPSTNLTEFTKEAKLIKYLNIYNSQKSPITCNRLNLLIDCLYLIKDSYTVKDKDTLRLTAGGTLKTLLRNIVEPILNLSITNNINHTISYILKKDSPSRITMQNTYNIDSHRLDSLITLYNYANGCDHILDDYSNKSYNITKYNIKYFENSLDCDKEKILTDLLFVLRIILTQTKDIYDKVEKLLQIY